MDFKLSACSKEAIAQKEIPRKVKATEHNELLQEKVKTNYMVIDDQQVDYIN